MMAKKPSKLKLWFRKVFKNKSKTVKAGGYGGMGTKYKLKKY